MRIRFTNRKMMVLCAVVAIMFVQVVSTSVTSISAAPVPAFVDTDLTSEGELLDAFVNDLAGYDKKNADIGKKASLTRAEFDLHERTSNDLKRRLSGIQSALVAAIRKLKAAGQWDDLDQILISKINDPKFQELVRREGFKKTLERAASVFANNPNEVVAPLDALRNKVQGQVIDSIPQRNNTLLAARVVRVSHTTPTPTMAAAGLKCSIAWIRYGFTAVFSKNGKPSKKASNAQDCYCMGDQSACDTLAAL